MLDAVPCAVSHSLLRERDMNTSTTDTSTTLTRLWTAEELAKATGLPKSRIYELSRTGDLPHARFGRALRYDPRRVAEWLASGGTASRSEG